MEKLYHLRPASQTGHATSLEGEKGYIASIFERINDARMQLEVRITLTLIP